jgi:hypothetical protein
MGFWQKGRPAEFNLCPVCGGRLDKGEEHINCTGCGRHMRSEGPSGSFLCEYCFAVRQLDITALVEELVRVETIYSDPDLRNNRHVCQVRAIGARLYEVGGLTEMFAAHRIVQMRFGHKSADNLYIIWGRANIGGFPWLKQTGWYLAYGDR